MENASKALIIAGAILLAILIISLGIMIYSRAQDTINNSGMSQTEVQAFNEKFVKYSGDQRGSSIRSLVQEVIASNGDSENQDASRQIAVDGTVTVTRVDNSNSGSSGTDNKMNVTGLNNVKNTKTYAVTFDYAKDGHINTIHITEKK